MDLSLFILLGVDPRDFLERDLKHLRPEGVTLECEGEQAHLELNGGVDGDLHCWYDLIQNPSNALLAGPSEP